MISQKINPRTNLPSVSIEPRFQYKILYYDSTIEDMATYTVYGRDKALEFAKGKKFVSITLNY